VKDRLNEKDGLKYVWIYLGTFQMGCSLGDSECGDNEKPLHQVTITKGFWMGQTEVTVGAYKLFAAATGRPMPLEPKSEVERPLNPAWGNKAVPIVDVTWDDAQAYCSWAGGRLPTEAEWEYAARGGSAESRYGPIDGASWDENNSGENAHEVGQKVANGFGLYDVLGNVREWVNDWFDANYYQTSPSQDPPGPTRGEERVLRGGAWSDFAKDIRVSSRVKGNPGNTFSDDGFRCVWTVSAP
jgi:formylglycine-generating enzyme required for sulfatase activity